MAFLKARATKDAALCHHSVATIAAQQRSQKQPFRPFCSSVPVVGNLQRQPARGDLVHLVRLPHAACFGPLSTPGPCWPRSVLQWTVHGGRVKYPSACCGSTLGPGGSGGDAGPRQLKGCRVAFGGTGRRGAGFCAPAGRIGLDLNPILAGSCQSDFWHLSGRSRPAILKETCND